MNIKVYSDGDITDVPGVFKPNDRVFTINLQEHVNGQINPFYQMEGRVVNAQPGDIDVEFPGLTDKFGVGFLPENLVRIPHRAYRKENYKKDFLDTGDLNWKTVILRTPHDPYYDGTRINGVVLHDGNYRLRAR